MADAYNHIWIDTNQKLIEFNPRNGSFRTYLTTDGSISVSYTHLDVYKRQVSDGFAYLKCDFVRWGAEKRMIKPLLEKAEDGRWYCRWQLTPSGKVWGTSHSCLA